MAVADTKVPLFKDPFWHFQVKIKFWKKSQGRAVCNYQTLTSSELFPVGIKLLLKGGTCRPCNVQGKACKQPYQLTKLKATPSDHPLKKTKWFWQNISFSNRTMENSASIVDMAKKTAKECLEHLNVPYAKWIVGTVLNSWHIQKEMTWKKKKL